MTAPEFYAVEGPDGIKSLHLGCVTVDWHLFDKTVTVCVKSKHHRIDVYSSATGRSLRAFKDGKEMP